MPQTQFNITVRGKVQGVWYRDSTRKVATEMGISGIVRNQPDGTVYIEAVGTKEQLNQLVEWCKNGPELARVDEVQVLVQIEVKTYTGFTITY